MSDAAATRALALTGGGARASYQAGVLRYVGEAFGLERFGIVTGVSAGAINAAHLANHTGTLEEATAALVNAWSGVDTRHIYALRSRWGFVRRILGQTPSLDPDDHGMVDTAPLRAFLRNWLGTPDGILRGTIDNLRSGRLNAFAVTATSYTTAQTMTWVQGREIERWERPNRLGVQSAVTVEHIMASSSLPFFFPAIRIGDQWYGDGGIRLSAPLAPAIHLGATSLMVVSTRYNRSKAEAEEHVIEGYPPAGQILSVLNNAIFLDAIEQDALHLRRINRLLQHTPRSAWGALRPVRLLLLRPSVDLGKLAREHELDVPPVLRLAMWGMGMRETKSPDSLSMLLFEQPYVQHLVTIGYEDARKQHDRIEAFFEPQTASV